MNQLGIDATLNHPTGAVAGICTSPSDKSVLLTRAEGSTSASLWKIPLEIMDQTDEAGFDHDDDDDSNDGNPDAALASSSMEEQAKMEHDTKLVDMKWRGGFDEESCANGNVLTLDEQGTISQWDVSFGAVESTRKTLVSVEGSAWNLPPRMAWDPHRVDTTTVSSRTSIDASMGAVESFPCHRYGIMDLDYNPNKPFILTTAGQDGLLKFWDLRSAKQPVLVARGGHRHWVSRVSYIRH